MIGKTDLMGAKYLEKGKKQLKFFIPGVKESKVSSIYEAVKKHV